MLKHATTKPVLDVMTRSPVTVDPGSSLGDLLGMFDRYDFNAFPVVDPAKILLGIVTKLDVLRALRPDAGLRLPDPVTLATVHAADLMRRGVLSVEAEDPLVVAADLMVETRLHSLPVVQRHAGGPPLLIGMISRGDLLRGLRFEMLEPAHTH